MRTDRVVRVFISSTFMDLQEERDHLVKHVFLELRKRCRERHAEFTGVDLRWGITDEQTAEGKVLPICLAEIEGCRPYFIGLLGERYGWVPQAIDEDLVLTQPWLQEHREKSVTELEVLHGVLNDLQMKGLAFFYFRKRERSDAIEQILSKEPGHKPEPEVSRTKLNTLKQRIEKSGYPLKKDFPDSKTLGQWVLEDLWSAIDKRYPIEKVPSEIQQRRMEHEAFASLRTRVYIDNKEYFERLDRHVTDDGPPLVILGESGSGKSALLANWAQAHRKVHPEDFMVSHYIGGTTDSADYVQLLRRIMEEIQERYEPAPKKEEGISQTIGEQGVIPTDPKKVVEAFPLWLGRAAARGRFILILDALNQLEDRDNAPDLGWLPWSFSPRVRLIVSTLPGRSLDALKKRNWPEMTVGLMEKTNQEKYIQEHLATYRKALEPARIKKIVAAPQAANPLYLRTLLEELRVFGRYEDLDKAIGYYLQAKTPDALFTLVLERLQRDYEHERKGIVSKVMSLIWASRRGLSETELLDLLGSQENPLPRAFFTPLYLALEESLVSRSGLLTFFHDFLKKAVETRYLSNPQDKQKAHLAIADYFDGKTLDDRKADELPWQLCQAEAWPRLKGCITDMDMFLKLKKEAKEYELTGYWLAMGQSYDMVEGYNEMIARYEHTSPDASDLCYLLNETAASLFFSARYDGAESLFRKGLAIGENGLGPEHLSTLTSLDSLAELLRSKGDYAGAEPLFRRALAIKEKVLGLEHPVTACTLNRLAYLLHDKGDYAGAEPLFRRALGIEEKVLGSEQAGTAVSLDLLAELLRSKGDYKGAEPLISRALAINEKIQGPEHPDTAGSLNNLAELLREKGDYANAEPISRRALAIREKVLGPEHSCTAQSLTNLALLLSSKGDYDGAEPLYRKAIAVYEKVLGPEHPYTAAALDNLAVLFYSKGDYKGAEPLYRRALAIREKALGPEHPYTATSLNNLAALFHAKRDYDGAEPLYRRAIAVYEKVMGSEHPSIAQSLNNLAVLLRSNRNYAGAETLFRKALDVRVKLLGPQHPDTAASCYNLAELLGSRGDYEGAESLYRRALAIREKVLGREHPDTLVTAENILQIAFRFLDQGDQPKAAELFRLVLDTYGRTGGGVREKMPEIIANLALCHNELAFHLEMPAKNWNEAEYHYRQSLDLFKKAGDSVSAANVELDLQTLFHLSGQPVDLVRVRELTSILENAKDKRAEKGQRLLRKLTPSAAR
jgi:tetratricopeptide (TPR) repeat protein